MILLYRPEKYNYLENSPFSNHQSIFVGLGFLTKQIADGGITSHMDDACLPQQSGIYSTVISYYATCSRAFCATFELKIPIGHIAVCA